MDKVKTDWVGLWKRSSIANACLVRITNQCNERCDHCCFRSGPDKIGQMDVETCHEINKWVPSRVLLNIMGGEITVLDNYPEILHALSRGRDHVRLVSNGFWAYKQTNIHKFLHAMKNLKRVCGVVDVAISDDEWHINSGKPAIKILRDNNPGVNLINDKEGVEVSVTPVGRAWDNQIATDIEQSSCQAMCCMIITENGMIQKCPYGYFPLQKFETTTWEEAQTQVWKWRKRGLLGGMNCQDCMEQVQDDQSVTPTEKYITLEPQPMRLR